MITAVFLYFTHQILRLLFIYLTVVTMTKYVSAHPTYFNVTTNAPNLGFQNITNKTGMYKYKIDTSKKHLTFDKVI